MIGDRYSLYLVGATGPSSPVREYLTTRIEMTPHPLHRPELSGEQELAAGSSGACRAASRLMSGAAERGLQYAREMSEEDTKYVDGC